MGGTLRAADESAGWSGRVSMCGSCSAELGQGAKFCSECGAPAPAVVLQCPQCAQQVPAGRFCANCGAALNSGEAPSIPSTIAERRVTSVLFADLVGFTPLSETRDAEEVRELLSGYFAECRTVVARNGGVVEKFIGDAVMAVWGVPVANEDDAERAVRAGLELVSMVTGYGEKVGAPGLAMRAGVVTGEVAVTVGATAEGMVAGDAVNTAARVQGAAEPGQVWVDATTRSLTYGAIAYDAVGEHALKGKSKAMILFAAREVVGEAGSRARIDGLEAPLAGRDRELRLITELFHSSMESGRPRLVVVDGEAGVGKTRLAAEFDKFVDGLHLTVRRARGRCLSYGQGMGFWPLGEAVRAHLGLLEGDTGDVVLDALEVALAEIIPDESEREWLRARLYVLIQGGSNADFVQSELFVAWATWWQRVAEQGPVVLLIEDAHHADDGLLDFVEHLLATVTAPVLVVALARPLLLERRPTIGGRRTTVVHLDPLDDETMSGLVDDLVTGLSGEEREALVQRADGIPLFAVETVRALIDRDLVVPRHGRYVVAEPTSLNLDEIGAPETLRALIAARLDALPPDERSVVANASVLGNTFTRAGLEALMPATRDLNPLLDSLQRREIISVVHERFTAERGQLRFVQTLVRQVAYAILSRRDRRTRHLAAAEHLAGLADPDELSALTAQHLLDAIANSTSDDNEVPELKQRACEMLEKAGRRARSLGSTAEASRLFHAAAELATDSFLRGRLLLDAGNTGLTAEDPSCLSHLRGARDLFADLENDAMTAWAVARLTLAVRDFEPSSWDPSVLYEWYERLADAQGADEALEQLSRSIFFAELTERNWVQLLESAHRWVSHAERVNKPDPLSQSISALGQVHYFSGRPELGLTLYRRAIDFAKEGDSLGNLAGHQAMLSWMYLDRDLAAADDLGREAFETSLRSGSPSSASITHMALCETLVRQGRFTEVQQLLTPESTARLSHQAFERLCLVSITHWVLEATGPWTQMATDADTQSELAELDELEMAAGRFKEQLLVEIRLRQAVMARDGDRARELADMLLPHVVNETGVEDNLGWLAVVRAAVLSGDVDLTSRVLDPVERAPEALLTPALRAERLWLRASAGALLNADLTDIERDFREGIKALDMYRAKPWAAQAREDFGRWLVDQGRAEEARTPLAEAHVMYEEMGALRWLSELNDWESARLAL